MSESAYLRRSLSQPIGYSREEGEAAKAVSESVSFGRFMNEALAWDKWSAFTRNRYLEEAERHSKPGSVAEKRAYFEAHFKRKAAERAAAAALAAAASENENRDQTKNDLPIQEEECRPNGEIKAEPPEISPPMIALSSLVAKKTARGSESRKKSERAIHSSLNLTSSRASDTRSSKAITVNGTSKRALPLRNAPGSSTLEARPSNGGEAIKPRPSIASLPFNLRSEERAARRKEFYEKLEERRKAEEAAKKLPQTKHQPNKTRKSGKDQSSDKIVRSSNHSLASRSQKKNARENSSPNIQNSLPTL